MSLARKAQPIGQGPVAVVEEEPVVAGAETQGRRGLDGLVARPVDLEEDLVLALAQDLLVVDAPGGIDRAEQVRSAARGERVVATAVLDGAASGTGTPFARRVDGPI